MTERSRTRASAAKAAPNTDGVVAPVAERRKRVALRRLIDDMLAEIRTAANEDNWTTDAREQAESDLARIMDQVRREALRAEPKAKAKRAKPR